MTRDRSPSNRNLIGHRFDTAMEACKKSGKTLMEFFNNLYSLSTETKSSTDIISSADKASDSIFISCIKESFPDDTIFSEETTSSFSNTMWVIDPLDGTVNFTSGLPLFCNSIAYIQDDKIEFGIVHAPALGLTYYAARDSIAYCNGIPLSIKRQTPRIPLFGFGYAFNSPLQNALARLESLLCKKITVRILGTGALALCFVADGRLIGFYEECIFPWDCMAGTAIVQRGGQHCSYRFSENSFNKGGPIFACPIEYKDTLGSALLL